MEIGKVKGGDASFLQIRMAGTVHSPEVGLPDLPVWRDLLQLPPAGRVEVVEVKASPRRIRLTERYGRLPVVPVQPSHPKHGVRPQQWHYDKARYRQDRWLGDSLVKIAPAGVLRGKRLALLTVSPFRYNPVRGELQLFSEVEITLRITGTGTKGASTALAAPAFEALDRLFLNASSSQTEASSVPLAPERYLILTLHEYAHALGDFVRWKRRQGFRVEMIFRGDSAVGSTADSLKDYLRSLYLSATAQNPAPSYLLIVGDTPQIPPSANPGRVTDLYYATYDGPDDYLPDLYYGRLPARDTTELLAMLDKLLEYEQYRFPDPSYLRRAVLVAGIDGTYGARWGNGQINYAFCHYINEDHGYDPSVYPYPVSGNSDAQIIEDISNGVSFVNYTGHGLSNGWKDPSFTLSDIPGLQNIHRYPLVLTNGCETAAFGVDECFGEAMVRAAGKGAVAYIGCSDDSYWDEDYYWAVGVGPIVADPTYEESSLGMYDRLYHDHQEPPEEWYVSASQMIFAGNLSVMKGNPSRAEYYWQIYHLFGDPSMLPWLAVPDTMEVWIPATLPASATFLPVVAEPQAYAGVTLGDTLLGAATIGPSGSLDLPLSSLPDTGTFTVTVTRQNRVPVVRTVRIIPDSLPYLKVDTLLLYDTNGVPVEAPRQEGVYRVDVVLTNTGGKPAETVSAALRNPTSWIRLQDTVAGPFSLAARTCDTLASAFRFQVIDSLPDHTLQVFHLHFSDTSGNSWDSWRTRFLLAAVPRLGRMSIDDLQEGNGNYRLDKGEKASLLLKVFNEGHAPMEGGHVSLLLTPSLVKASWQTIPLPRIEPGQEVTLSFPVEIADTVPPGSFLIAATTLNSSRYSVSDTFSFPVDRVYDDFEHGNLLALPWKTGDVDVPWEIDGNTAWHGTMSAVSGRIGHGQSSTLTVQCYVPQDDSIVFHVKVSSEKDYDILHFYIDEEEKESWSGEVEWRRVVFPVDSGEHTFKWVYRKDGNTSRGLDRAWIDMVFFPAHTFSHYIVQGERELRDERKRLLLYPNPAGDHLTVSAGMPVRIDQMFLLDMKGTRWPVRERSSASWDNTFTLTTAHLPPGTYLLVILTDKGRWVAPFVKR